MTPSEWAKILAKLFLQGMFKCNWRFFCLWECPVVSFSAVVVILPVLYFHNWTGTSVR